MILAGIGFGSFLLVLLVFLIETIQYDLFFDEITRLENKIEEVRQNLHNKKDKK